jgi:hypothetical protein
MKRLLAACIVVSMVAACGADGGGAEDRIELSVSVTTPTPGWVLKIEEVYTVDGEIWIIARLTGGPGGIVVQVLGSASDSIRVAAPALPVRRFVIGSALPDANPEITFISGREQIAGDLARGERIFQQKQ